MDTGMSAGPDDPGPWRWPPTWRRPKRPAPQMTPPPSPEGATAPVRRRTAPPLYPTQPTHEDMAAARSRLAGPVSASPSTGTTPRPRPSDRGRVQPGRRTPESPTGSPSAVLEIADAAALAAAFAADFLSWDEADPTRRAGALASYASADEDQLAVGWSGTGRQRAELALPGTVVRLGAHDVLVHVRVRVTPFRRRAGAPAGQTSTGSFADLLPFPAAAPAPAHPH